MPTTKEMERIMHGVENSNLPPSIEAAYYKKAIELKRRVNEIEHNNDVKRANLQRVNRDVQKLRLERALLIEMIRNGVESMPADSASEASEDDAPPSPPNKPARTKRVSGSKGKSKADGDDEDVDDTVMLPGTSPPPQDTAPISKSSKSRLSHAASMNGAADTAEDVAMTDDAAVTSNSTSAKPEGMKAADDAGAAGGGGASGFTAVNE